MALSHFPARVLLAAASFALLLLAVCGAVAASLALEQSRTADVVDENIGSLQAATDLKESVTALATLLERGIDDLGPLHERAALHLAAIKRYADKEQERESGECPTWIVRDAGWERKHETDRDEDRDRGLYARFLARGAPPRCAGMLFKSMHCSARFDESF